MKVYRFLGVGRGFLAPGAKNRGKSGFWGKIVKNVGDTRVFSIFRENRGFGGFWAPKITIFGVPPKITIFGTPGNFCARGAFFGPGRFLEIPTFFPGFKNLGGSEKWGSC